MRKVVYLVTTSLDGFIADAKGGTSWMVGAPGSDYGFAQFYAEVGTILAGRKTYEVLAEKTAYGFFPYPDKEFMCITDQDDLEQLSDNVSFIKPAALFKTVARLKIEDESKGLIWLAGGAQLASTLIDEGLVDELRVATVPILVGSGISLAANITKIRPLTLIDSESRSGGVLVSRYRIRKQHREESELNMAQ